MKFTNGVYFVDKHIFSKHDLLTSPENIHIERLLYPRVSFNSSLMKYKPDNWNNVNTPLDNLFMKQNLDNSVTVWIYALIGRLMRKKCNLDEWGNITVMNFGVGNNAAVIIHRRFNYFSFHEAWLKCSKEHICEYTCISNLTTWRTRVRHNDTMKTNVNSDECIVINYPIPLNEIYCSRIQKHLAKCADRLAVKCNLAYLYLVQKYGKETNLYNVLPKYFKQTREMIDFQELPQTYQ